MSDTQPNGAGVELPGLPVARGNPELVKMLEQALSQARSGQLVGLGLVMVYGPDNLNCAAGGGLPATIAAGCHKIAGQLTDALFAKRSPIIQPKRV